MAFISCETGNFHVAVVVGTVVKVDPTGAMMTGTSYITAAARIVRISAATLVVMLLVAYLAVQAFATHYNDLPTTQTVLARPAENRELAAAITDQVSRGLTCREEPSLTDTILFQASGETEVQVLTFEEALAASSERAGWIRRYCF